MRPIAFGEALPAGSRLTLFSDDKPDRFFTVIKFWMDETSGVALALRTGVPSYQVEDEGLQKRRKALSAAITTRRAQAGLDVMLAGIADISIAFSMSTGTPTRCRTLSAVLP